MYPVSYNQVEHLMHFDAMIFQSGECQGQARLFHPTLLKQEMFVSVLSVLGLHAASCTIEHCQKQPPRS